MGGAGVRAVVFRRHGGTEVLELAELPDPKPASNEVLLSIKACALNRLDIWVRQGIPGPSVPMPHIGGSDICGEIIEAGSGVEGRKAGELVVVAPGVGCRVCESCLAGKESLCDHYQLFGFQKQGGYAEKIAVDVRDVIPVPKGLTPVEWAAVPLVFLTAWHMLVTRAQLKGGETVLIQAAGSGIGSAAIQIAKYLGARVIATASTDAKLSKARSLGADEGIHYKDLPIAHGADVVFEHIGPETFAGSLASLKKEGRLVFCGATSGANVSFDLRPAYLKHLTIHGSFMGGRGELLHVLKLIESGCLHPVVDSTFPLEKAREAQEKMLSRDVFGKIVLKVA